MRWIPAFLMIAGILWALVPLATGYSQNPVPTGFMRDVEYPNAPPDDGAAVLVLDGLAAGIGTAGTCALHPVDEIVYLTVSRLNAGEKIITEVSPQSYCSDNIQDWKNVALQLVTRIQAGSPNAATLWGGLMLDEEEGFWITDKSSAVEAFKDLNSAVASLLTLYQSGGWYFTETYSNSNPSTGVCDWSQADFDGVTGYSVAAPQIASGCMVRLTNTRQSRTGENILVTWSLNQDYQFGDFYGADGRVNGAPYNNFYWGIDLSNCFRGGAVCNDWDADGVINTADNCMSIANASQRNYDANFIDLPPSKAFDDNTRANSDAAGDACDSDDDNDGLIDSDEQALGPSGSRHFLCPSATGNTSTTDEDTDNDTVTDGAECALGSDPVDPASKPPAPPPGTDPDFDGLSTSFELSIGTNPNAGDSDGDAALDGVEVKGYNTNPLGPNTDGDVCGDAREIASVDAGIGVSSIDLNLVAAAFSPTMAPPYIKDFDVNKNGRISSVDLQFVSGRFGPCP